MEARLGRSAQLPASQFILVREDGGTNVLLHGERASYADNLFLLGLINYLDEKFPEVRICMVFHPSVLKPKND